jgi:hypothetical protein
MSATRTLQVMAMITMRSQAAAGIRFHQAAWVYPSEFNSHQHPSPETYFSAESLLSGFRLGSSGWHKLHSLGSRFAM